MTRWLPWLLVLALLGAGLVVGYVLVRDRRAAIEAQAAESEALRAAEAETLEAAGLVVVARRDRAALEARVAELLERDEVLVAELARARKAARDLRVVGVVEASTGPVEATGDPRPPDTGDGLCPACLVAPGDRLEIRVGEVLAATRAGNRIVLGAAQLWRLSPAPASRLMSAAFSAPLTEASAVVEPVAARGWSTWAIVAAGVGGAVAGVLIAGIVR